MHKAWWSLHSFILQNYLHSSEAFSSFMVYTLLLQENKTWIFFLRANEMSFQFCNLPLQLYTTFYSSNRDTLFLCSPDLFRTQVIRRRCLQQSWSKTKATTFLLLLLNCATKRAQVFMCMFAKFGILHKILNGEFVLHQHADFYTTLGRQADYIHTLSPLKVPNKMWYQSQPQLRTNFLACKGWKATLYKVQKPEYSM